MGAFSQEGVWLNRPQRSPQTEASLPFRRKDQRETCIMSFMTSFSCFPLSLFAACQLNAPFYLFLLISQLHYICTPFRNMLEHRVPLSRTVRFPLKLKVVSNVSEITTRFDNLHTAFTFTQDTNPRSNRMKRGEIAYIFMHATEVAIKRVKIPFRDDK